MAQERYFDYKSEIKSKKSAEQGLILDGVGPQYGFDKVTLDLANGTVTLDTNQPKTLQDLKDIYTNNPNDWYNQISDIRFLNQESGAFKPIIGAVVTLDGTLTLVDEPVTIDLPEDFMTEFNSHTNASEVCNWCLCITAYHNYQPSASPFATIFRVAAWCMGSATSSSSSNFNRICTLQKEKFKNWFTDFSQTDDTNFYDKMNQPNEVFIGLYTFFTVNKEVINKDTNLPSIMSSSRINPQFWMNRWCVPYHYKWDPDEVEEVLEVFNTQVSNLEELKSIITRGNSSKVVLGIYTHTQNPTAIEQMATKTIANQPENISLKDLYFKIERAKVTKHKAGFIEYEVYGYMGYYNFKIPNESVSVQTPIIRKYFVENSGIMMDKLTEYLHCYGGNLSNKYYVEDFKWDGYLTFEDRSDIFSKHFPFTLSYSQPHLNTLTGIFFDFQSYIGLRKNGSSGSVVYMNDYRMVVDPVSIDGFPLTPQNNKEFWNNYWAKIQGRFYLNFYVAE